MRYLPLFLFAPVVLSAQPIYVYSEFARVVSQGDGRGQVTAPARPREILSPAIVRNGFTSFQVVVETEPSKTWWLHMGQNPENAVTVTMYRENGDKLEKVDLPVKGQGTQVFWMDVWAARNLATGRIKVEPQLNIDDDWIIYPMEARVEDPVLPDFPWKPTLTGPSAAEQMRTFVCTNASPAAPPPGEGFSTQGMRYRNGLEDVALARQAPKSELQKLLGACDAALSTNPEAYFPIRDYLFKHALH